MLLQLKRGKNEQNRQLKNWLTENEYKIFEESWEQQKEMNPDYIFVFSWHFKDFILGKEKYNAEKNYSLLFPLLSIEII